MGVSERRWYSIDPDAGGSGKDLSNPLRLRFRSGSPLGGGLGEPVCDGGLEPTDASAEDGITYLDRLLRHSTNPQFVQMVRDGESVHCEFGGLFHPDNLHKLTATEFKEFLLYEHNRHWWGIHRHQAKLVADMDRCAPF